MRKLRIVLLLSAIMFAVLVMTGVVAVLKATGGQNPAPRVIDLQRDGVNVREVAASTANSATEAPLIGFIDSPSATCYQPDPRQDVCYINRYYQSVSAFPNYMITMTVMINAIGVVAHTQGFFQTSMYVPYNMYGQGFKVACGALGAGGDPQLGSAYQYTIRARDSANLGSANYGTVYCPARKP